MNSIRLKQFTFFCLMSTSFLLGTGNDEAFFYKKFRKIQARRCLGSALAVSAFSWCCYNYFFKQDKNSDLLTASGKKTNFEQKYLELYLEHNSWSYKTKDFLFKALACPVILSTFGLFKENKLGIFSYFYSPLSYKKVVKDQFWILYNSLEEQIEKLNILELNPDSISQVEFSTTQLIDKCQTSLKIYEKFEKNSHISRLFRLLKEIDFFINGYSEKIKNFSKVKKLDESQIQIIRYTLTRLSDLLAKEIQSF